MEWMRKEDAARWGGVEGVLFWCFLLHGGLVLLLSKRMVGLFFHRNQDASCS